MSPPMRTSKRKEASKLSSTNIQQCFNSSKKLKKSPALSTSSVKALPKTLLQLPLGVLERLQIFLDVSSLEKLGATCSYLHQLISGRNITTLDFPFSPTFVSELRRELVLEKKPLLRLRNVKYTEGVPKDGINDYIISSQMALLSLDSLRELYLLPNAAVNWAGQHSLVTSHVNFYDKMLRYIFDHGNLGLITRLDILVDQHCKIACCINELPSLLHLGLTIGNLKPISSTVFKDFLRRLEEVVKSCRAPSLSVSVLDESRKKTIKVFANRFVKKLSFRLPCNFNLHLAMPALEEVVLEHQEPTCTFFKSSSTDRNLHRPGLCGVSLASCFRNCPNIKTFSGVHIGHLSQDQTFSKWSNKMKKPFHSDYLARGGQLDLKTWSRARGGRWFRRQEALPACIGYERDDF